MADRDPLTAAGVPGQWALSKAPPILSHFARRRLPFCFPKISRRSLRPPAQSPPKPSAAKSSSISAASPPSLSAPFFLGGLEGRGGRMQAAAGTGTVSWVAAHPSVLGRCGGAPAKVSAGSGGGGGVGGGWRARGVGVPRCCARARRRSARRGCANPRRSGGRWWRTSSTGAFSTPSVPCAVVLVWYLWMHSPRGVPRGCTFCKSCG